MITNFGSIRAQPCLCPINPCLCHIAFSSLSAEKEGSHAKIEMRLIREPELFILGCSTLLRRRSTKQCLQVHLKGKKRHDLAEGDT